MSRPIHVDRQPEGDIEFLETILRHPGTRVRVVRDRDAHLVGFSTVLPVCQETVLLLDLHEGLAPFVHAYWTPEELKALPATPEATNIFFLLHLAEGDVLPEAVAAALIRDHFGLFALGGVYLVMVLNSMPRRLLLEACGFERVPEARTWVYGPEDPFDGYVLDLTYIGVERWFEAIVRGQRPPKVRNRSELERELEDALQHWRDDTWLAESNLARAVVPLDLLPPAEEGDRGTGPRFSAVLARPSEGNRQSLTHKRAPCIPRVLLHPSSDATESYGPQQVETGVKPG